MKYKKNKASMTGGSNPDGRGPALWAAAAGTHGHSVTRTDEEERRGLEQAIAMSMTRPGPELAPGRVEDEALLAEHQSAAADEPGNLIAYKIWKWDISYDDTHKKFYLTGERPYPTVRGIQPAPEQIRSEIEDILPDGAIANGDTTSPINENSFYTISTIPGRNRKIYDLFFTPDYLKYDGKIFNLLAGGQASVNYSKVRGIFEGIYKILHSWAHRRQPDSRESEIMRALGPGRTGLLPSTQASEEGYNTDFDYDSLWDG